MAKFKSGDRVRIVRANKVSTALGREGTVIERADTPPWSTKPDCEWYLVSIDGLPPPHGRGWKGPHYAMERLVPPGWQLTTWGNCLWRPHQKVEVPQCLNTQTERATT